MECHSTSVTIWTDKSKYPNDITTKWFKNIQKRNKNIFILKKHNKILVSLNYHKISCNLNTRIRDRTISKQASQRFTQYPSLWFKFRGNFLFHFIFLLLIKFLLNPLLRSHNQASGCNNRNELPYTSSKLTPHSPCLNFN